MKSELKNTLQVEKGKGEFSSYSLLMWQKVMDLNSIKKDHGSYYEKEEINLVIKIIKSYIRLSGEIIEALKNKLGTSNIC